MFSVWVSAVGLTILLEDLRHWTERANDTQPGMERVIKEVVIPEINANFMAGGRPPWEPVDENTIRHKSLYGWEQRPLISTGLLLEEATNFSNWTISQDDAFFALPEDAAYGAVHESGTDNIPQREFTNLSEEALARMAELMNAWVLGEE